ncbi:hypothetical protein AGMMS49982_13230 [Bacteroidia bacterium]|nr:hypothetical protein AGMMS49982_13230 [Bacteroidia bacterium]
MEATEQFIPQHRVDAIADALYEYAFENDILLPVNEQTFECYHKLEKLEPIEDCPF